jgi:hypothetical protein
VTKLNELPGEPQVATNVRHSGGKEGLFAKLCAQGRQASTTLRAPTSRSTR